MKIKYNAPVILSFSLVSAAILLVSQLLGSNGSIALFSVPGRQEGFRLLSLDAVRLITHVLGHANWAHLLGNVTFILLIGPILEEKYGSSALLLMMFVTALVTGCLNVIIFPAALLGASGIVFMLILLISFTNIRAGEIPLTFILVVVLFLTREIVGAFQDNNISEFAHIAGGLCGSLFGFVFRRGEKNLPPKQDDGSITQHR